MFLNELQKLLDTHNIALVGTLRLREGKTLIDEKDTLELSTGRHVVRDTMGPFLMFTQSEPKT